MPATWRSPTHSTRRSANFFIRSRTAAGGGAIRARYPGRFFRATAKETPCGMATQSARSVAFGAHRPDCNTSEPLAPFRPRQPPFALYRGRGLGQYASAVLSKGRRPIRHSRGVASTGSSKRDSGIRVSAVGEGFGRSIRNRE